MEAIERLYKANFDYESALYENRSDPKVNNLLEHLFFFCSDKKEALLTNNSYSDEYLEYIKKATGFKNQTRKTGNFLNWWGDLTDLEKEKELNSKLTSLEISKLLNSNASSAEEINKIEDIRPLLKKYGEVFLRTPYERSGRKNLILLSLEDLEKNTQQIEKLLEASPLLVEKNHKKRDFDLGSTFEEIAGEFKLSFQIKNLNDSKGVFRGGVLLKTHLGQIELKKIAKEYYNRGARERLQIDSFRFEENWNWLCEVNYRKTMGLVVKKLSRLCPPSNETALLVTPSSWLKKYSSLSELCHSLEEIDGVFPLSPIESPVKFWLVTAADINKLYEEVVNWWAVIALKGRKLPSVFSKIITD
ncbi:MAG: hypothetical protein ACJAT2_000149 [Bacteriovoracaceae bacterium]